MLRHGRRLGRTLEFGVNGECRGRRECCAVMGRGDMDVGGAEGSGNDWKQTKAGEEGRVDMAKQGIDVVR